MSREPRPAAAAMLRRRSQSSVTEEAPGRKELLRLIEAAGSVADHSALHPWRIIELRGKARRRLGEALAEAEGGAGNAVEKQVRKARRAPLVLAIVFSPKPSRKVPDWEQEAVASGVAHALSLVLDEAGWGVFWRTGLQTRSRPVHRAHRLEPQEELLGWLYVGGRGERQARARKPIRAARFLSRLTG
ncbi:nitroreductase family protein [Homoserinibacter sp. YIM 151385]|uniref:nitroreductase family protein n=1 Tax=Homoserinibacter sp. YIM 151385 TaxID=2985506 RepID=UPI0022F0DF7D|nr:nitroreductase family protein [Homoserinibacter sp. YIM 151385]WBU37849.1 nitroreductase family protein [Homoserinibacter sp. YIM 151385]